jgi:hypothetical protein
MIARSKRGNEVASEEKSIEESSKLNDASTSKLILGENFSPKPTKDQLVDEFEKEELSKIDMTWSEFIKTDFFKKNKDIYLDMLSRDPQYSTNPGEKIDESERLDLAVEEAKPKDESGIEKEPLQDVPPVAMPKK